MKYSDKPYYSVRFLKLMLVFHLIFLIFTFNIILRNVLFTSSAIFDSLILSLGENLNTVTRILISSFEANTWCRFSNEVTALLLILAVLV